MRYRKLLGIIVLAAMAAVAMPANADAGKGKGSGDQDHQMDRSMDRDVAHDMDRDRTQDRMVSHDQLRIQDRDRVYLQDPMRLRDEDIYGSALMTGQEMTQYRNRMASMETRQEREQYQVQHEEQMQERARQQGKDLVPPGQGPIYGGKLMSVEERNQYREQLRRIESDEDRLKFQAQHREKMDARANALELEVE
jgi:Spy/CpxP family protein refolding chaperone